MPVPPEIHDWIARSDVDHVGPFVNAWAGFNAWYRHVSQTKRDRDGLNFVRSNPNAVRSAIIPLLDPDTPDTQDATEFKTAIAALHSSLEHFRLETLYEDELEHVSFRSVPLNKREPLPATKRYRLIDYRVDRAAGNWLASAQTAGGAPVATISHAQYGLLQLEADQQFAALSAERKAQLRALYLRCNPRPFTDLTSGHSPVISAGAISFRCSCEDLFGGVIETLYRMRNMLLHGELAPHPDALAAYDPAYRLLRRMLRSV